MINSQPVFVYGRVMTTTESTQNCNIEVTEAAQQYLAELLKKQETPGMGVRIFVENPGTPRAECCMAYASPEDTKDSDQVIELAGFNAHIDASSVIYLMDAVIDYNKDRFGGQLTFKAPNSKVPRVGPDASLEERVNYVLASEINPNLAAHGGNVQLLELIEDTDAGLTAVLKFGGGCQGCSAVDMTLKQGVETTLKQQVPEIMQVVDDTDHSVTDQAYFK